MYYKWYNKLIEDLPEVYSKQLRSFPWGLQLLLRKLHQIEPLQEATITSQYFFEAPYDNRRLTRCIEPQLYAAGST